VLAHASLVIGLNLSQFGFLIGSQNLHDFGLDALVLDLQLDHGLRVLRGERGHLGFIEGTGGLQSFHGALVLAHLLHQWLQGRLLFFKDRLDLAVLIAGQIVGVAQAIGQAGIAERQRPVADVAQVDEDPVPGQRRREFHGRDFERLRLKRESGDEEQCSHY